MSHAARINVIAAFPDAMCAEGAVRKLTSVGVRRSDVQVVRPERDGTPERRAAVRSEMQDGVTESFGRPGVGFATAEQTQGAFVGTIAGLAAGAVLGAAAGLLWIAATHSAVAKPVRMVIAVVAFAVGGAIAGFIAGGAFKPRFDAAREGASAQLGGKRFAAERDTVVAVHVDDPATVDRTRRILRDSGAERVDTVTDD